METKQEFLDGLRRALTGKISQLEIEDHIRYYEDYITAETRIKGSERAVLDALGEPRLIAMSICAADAAGERVNGGYNTSEDAYGNYNAYTSETAYSSDNMDDARQKDDRPFIIRHPKLTIVLILVAIVAIIILVIALAFSLLKLLWPVIVVIVVVALIVRVLAFLSDR